MKLLCKNPATMIKNRYSDILPYEHTRVKLLARQIPKPGSDIVDQYINANYVDSPLAFGDKKIIATQGPTKETVFDFWRMVTQERVGLIVTTCNLVEGTRTKCEQFWPYQSEGFYGTPETGI